MRTAAFYAPSKTFNLAGLVGSYHIVYNNWWRDRIEKESSLNHYNMMNVRTETFLQEIDKSRIDRFEEEFAQYEKDLEEAKKEQGKA